MTAQSGKPTDETAAAPRAPRSWAPYATVVTTSLLAAIVAIAIMDLALPEEWQALLLDRERSTYPLTVQNIMAFGCAELFIRYREARAEEAELSAGYLPQDERTILQSPELRQVYALTREAMASHPARRGRYLPRLIHRVITQFQTTHSIDQSATLLNSSLELYLHEVDIRYNMIRYVVWAIPALGFIGTVVGISLALNFASTVDLQDPSLLVELTKRLGVAFNTTLLALVMSIVLVLGQHKIQAYEERVLNEAGQLCLDNLINRLYVS
jgi:biopolymer transport protein ExbB/TolQ